MESNEIQTAEATVATKLEKILIERNMSQGELIRKIQENSGFRMGRDRISKICTGRLKNFTMETAVMIAEALEIKVDDIVELKNVKKRNSER
jgi:DNA-binding Xre family transcriptional regulator